MLLVTILTYFCRTSYHPCHKTYLKKNQDLSLCHYPTGCLVYIWLGELWRTNFRRCLRPSLVRRLLQASGHGWDAWSAHIWPSSPRRVALRPRHLASLMQFFWGTEPTFGISWEYHGDIMDKYHGFIICYIYIRLWLQYMITKNSRILQQWNGI